MRDPLIIGTRGSDLALWQARFVQDRLHDIGLKSELKIIKTQGDAIQDLSFDKLEGKGFFTKEIEEALLREETDIAVHSHKDLPTSLAEGLIIAAVSDREDPAELLLIRKDKVDVRRKFNLAKGALVGSSSARRKSLMLAFRPDVKLKDLRGNVPTRVQKLRNGEYDAILLAAAGVERLALDLQDFQVERLDPVEFTPAPAQGVLAIQIRSGDTELFNKLQALHHPEIAEVIGLERKVLQLFQGGCQMPVGVYASYDSENEKYCVRASRAIAWDQPPVMIYSDSADAVGLGERVVEKILQVKPNSVFITRTLNEESCFLNVLTAHGYQVSGKALIETVVLPYTSLPDHEWIFFSSKHAVKYFFSQQPQVENSRFACIGKSTAELLRKFGKRAEFIGASADTKMIGKQFASKVGSGRVLFPQAKGSLRSVQNQFVKKDQVIDLPVYETLKKNDGIQPEAGILVFTSPSNVEAWFERFKIRPDQKVIAMGDATANALRQSGIRSVYKSDSFDETGLLRAVFGAASQ